MLGKKAWSKK